MTTDFTEPIVGIAILCFRKHQIQSQSIYFRWTCTQNALKGLCLYFWSVLYTLQVNLSTLKNLNFILTPFKKSGSALAMNVTADHATIKLTILPSTQLHVCIHNMHR